MRGRLAHTLQSVRAYTLCQLEDHFAHYLSPSPFPKAAKKANSRDRIYTRPRTFWSMLWQALNPKASGRQVVRQIQALFQLHAGPSPSEQDGAYCRAKARLPLKEFPKALSVTAQAADRLAQPERCSKPGQSRSLTAPRSPPRTPAKIGAAILRFKLPSPTSPCCV